jgi:hypothetical protein
MLAGTGSFGSRKPYIGVIPVNSMHPYTLKAHEDQTMKYYWKTTRGGELYRNLTFEYRFNVLL